jgi:NAD(P)-dependent dehydrogenase (short-subunit alcohol dehydrogenase family)
MWTHVFVSGRRQSEVDTADKQIGKNIDNVTGIQGNVSNLADLDWLYATVKEQKGRIDILFANASWRISSIGGDYRSAL